MRSNILSPLLITGGTGLLGINWAILERSRTKIYLGIHERKITINGVDCVNLELSNIEGLCRVIRSLEIKLVIHSAALTNVELCEKTPNLAHKINVEYSKNVAIACLICGVRMVHISTDHLFSGNTSYALEDEIPAPINVYGSSKSEAEFSVAEINPDALIVRTNFFGWGTSYRKSFSDWIIDNLRSQEAINLFTDVYFTPIYTYDLICIIKKILTINYRGVINIVSGEKLSKYDFGVKISEIFNLNQSLIKKEYLASNANLIKRPNDMSLSSKKIESMIFEPIRSIDSQLVALRDHEYMFDLEI